MEWKFTIVEKSVFCVDLDTEDEDEAYEKIREMFFTGEICVEKPDVYENDECIEAN